MPARQPAKCPATLPAKAAEPATAMAVTGETGVKVGNSVRPARARAVMAVTTCRPPVTQRPACLLKLKWQLLTVWQLPLSV